jgi:lysozyme
MKTSVEGVKFIQDREGTELVAYKDIGGIWTIGTGHAGPEVHAGLTITPETALNLLENDLATAEHAVNTLVITPLNQHQFDALVSWTFNLGEGNLRLSTLLKDLNAGLFDLVPNQIRLWNHCAGKISEGLTDRREREAILFTTGNYQL